MAHREESDFMTGRHHDERKLRRFLVGKLIIGVWIMIKYELINMATRPQWGNWHQTVRV